MSIGIYAGSFDPITLGHLDIIKRSLSVCKELYVVVGVNSQKKTTFSEAERLELVSKTLDGLSNVYVTSYSGLIVEFAKVNNASVLIRGIRSVTDFEYELNLALINKKITPSVETVLIPADPTLSIVSSSAAKELVKHGASVKEFVHESVEAALKEKIKTG